MNIKNLLLFSTLVLATSPAYGADIEKGKTLFAQRCAMCHGDKGAGDGPIAATMPEDQRPRNLTTGVNKYATDDAKLTELLMKGGAELGLSVMMPAQSDLKAAELADLVAFVNSLKK
jgi:cytochrome c